MGLGSELYSTSNGTQSWPVSVGTGTNCVQHITIGSDVQKVGHSVAVVILACPCMVAERFDLILNLDTQ
jgi:hypothetical protein